MSMAQRWTASVCASTTTEPTRSTGLIQPRVEHGLSYTGPERAGRVLVLGLGDPGAFMTVPDRFPREVDVSAEEESTVTVPETPLACS